MLHIAQGNALGWAYALINTFGILRLSRQNATRPWRVTSFVIIFLFVMRFLRVAFLRRRLKNAECINRGVRFPRALPWLWATTGLTARHNYNLLFVACVLQNAPTVCNGLFFALSVFGALA